MLLDYNIATRNLYYHRQLVIASHLILRSERTFGGFFSCHEASIVFTIHCELTYSFINVC